MTDPIVRAHPAGALVSVWVVPGAAQSEIVGPHGDALRIRVQAPPEGERANRAVAKLLGHATGSRRVHLVRGGGSRRKTFQIEGVAAGPAREALGLTRRNAET